MAKLTHHETGEILDLPELIELQSANVNQLTADGVKGDWKVKKNITGEVLYSFPPLADKVMRSVLNFAQDFELKAFNAGINYQKAKNNAVLEDQIRILTSVNKELADENIRLSTLLENLLPEE